MRAGLRAARARTRSGGQVAPPAAVDADAGQYEPTSDTPEYAL